MGEIYDPNCKHFKERNGKTKVWVEDKLAEKLNKFAANNKSSPSKIAEYCISMGINSLEHCPNQPVIFDKEILK
tara:strand:- start:1993 stop:2214 length:222 start_codon:yes stop_codon:yes gene_type:complete